MTSQTAWGSGTSAQSRPVRFAALFPSFCWACFAVGLRVIRPCHFSWVILRSLWGAANTNNGAMRIMGGNPRESAMQVRIVPTFAQFCPSFAPVLLSIYLHFAHVCISLPTGVLKLRNPWFTSRYVQNGSHDSLSNSVLHRFELLLGQFWGK